jgi:hypothetical protein
MHLFSLHKPVISTATTPKEIAEADLSGEIAEPPRPTTLIRMVVSQILG